MSCVDTCAVCLTTRRKKEVQAKPNRPHTKNKEKKRIGEQRKNDPCGE
jgi:hypothetical protein